MNSFVRFPFIRFKKAEAHEWAKETYIDSEKRKQQEAIAAYLECAKLIAAGEQEKGMDIQKEYYFEPHYNILFDLIRAYTVKNPNYDLITKLVNELKIADIKVIVGERLLCVEADDLNFFVQRFSEVEPNIKRILPELETYDRKGRCHPYSVLTAMYYSGRSDLKAEMVTGRIYQLSNKADYLHSWVEVDNGYQVLVVDAAKNIVMPKAAFYEIHHVKETERVSAETVAKDYKMIKKLTDYDEYLVKVYYENAKNGRNLYKKLIKMGEIQPEPNAD